MRVTRPPTPLAQRIVDERTAAGLAREQVAAALHVSAKTVERWETAVVVPPAIALIAFAHVVGGSRDPAGVFVPVDLPVLLHLRDTQLGKVTT